MYFDHFLMFISLYIVDVNDRQHQTQDRTLGLRVRSVLGTLGLCLVDDRTLVALTIKHDEGESEQC
jgi:hypothetical protein